MRSSLAVGLFVLVAAACSGARPAAPPDDPCVRAERCCREGFPLLAEGKPCDVTYELGDRTATTCERTLSGFRKLFEVKALPLPASCRAP